MVQQSRQLKMSFAGDGRLAEAMRSGQFCFLLEMNSPPGSQPLESYMAVATPLFKRVGALAGVHGVAVTDRWPTVLRRDPVDFSAQAAESSGKPVMMAISGRGTDLARAKTLLAEARAKGIRCFLAVTGDLLGQESADGVSDCYLDGVATGVVARQFGSDSWVGAAVNPYKYTCEGVFLQYAKLQRKVTHGAGFLVAQLGWDMKKAQELQWFLQMRELYLPMLARVVVMSQDDALKLADGFWPGVHVPIPLAAMMMREAEASPDSFLEAQLSRAALQIVGSRLLGYSGVQVAGVRTPNVLSQLVGRVQDCAADCPDYDAWLEAWHQRHGDISFGPGVSDVYPDPPYYLFPDLLQPGRRDYAPELTQPGYNTIAPPTLGDRWTRWLHRPTRPRLLREAARRISWRSEAEAAAASLCQGLLNRSCPKRLVYGACGGSSTDGLCEEGGHECFFHRVIRLANAANDLEAMENGEVAK